MPGTWTKQNGKWVRKPKEFPAKVPQTAWEATKMGLQDAKLSLQRIGQSAVNAVVSDKTLPNKEEVLERIDKKREDVNEKRDQYDGGGGAGGFLKEAAVRLPGNMVKVAADVYNPSKKVEAANAVYHAGRKYAETGSVREAAVSGVSSLVGDKVDALVGRIPGMPKNLAGNAAGSVLENAANSLLDKKPPLPTAPSKPSLPANPSPPVLARRPSKKKGLAKSLAEARAKGRTTLVVR
jgi:hypothetical protein